MLRHIHFKSNDYLSYYYTLFLEFSHCGVHMLGQNLQRTLQSSSSFSKCFCFNKYCSPLGQFPTNCTISGKVDQNHRVCTCAGRCVGACSLAFTPVACAASRDSEYALFIPAINSMACMCISAEIY